MAERLVEGQFSDQQQTGRRLCRQQRLKRRFDHGKVPVVMTRPAEIGEGHLPGFPDLRWFAPSICNLREIPFGITVQAGWKQSTLCLR